MYVHGKPATSIKFLDIFPYQNGLTHSLTDGILEL